MSGGSTPHSCHDRTVEFHPGPSRDKGQDTGLHFAAAVRNYQKGGGLRTARLVCQCLVYNLVKQIVYLPCLTVSPNNDMDWSISPLIVIIVLSNLCKYVRKHIEAPPYRSFFVLQSTKNNITNTHTHKKISCKIKSLSYGPYKEKTWTCREKVNQFDLTFVTSSFKQRPGGVQNVVRDGSTDRRNKYTGPGVDPPRVKILIRDRLSVFSGPLPRVLVFYKDIDPASLSVSFSRSVSLRLRSFLYTPQNCHIKNPRYFSLKP